MNNSMKNHRRSGFTLIEIMVVVVIIGILAAIVMPNYRDYVTQTRRTDAQVALTSIANAQEKFFTECNWYARTLEGANRVCGANNALGVLAVAAAAPVLSPDRHYLITVRGGIQLQNLTWAADCGADNGACGFTLYANPNDANTTGQQNGDGRFMLNSRGQKYWDRNNDNDYVDAKEDRWTK